MRLLRHVPLSIKLVASVMALVVAALVIIGVSSTYFLRDYLVGKVDGELRSYYRQLTSALPSGTPSLPTDYLVVSTDGSYRVQAVFDPRFHTDDLPAPLADYFRPSHFDQDDLDRILRWFEQHSDGEAFTATAADRRTHWRMIVVDLGEGRYVAVGQDLSDVELAVSRLVVIDALVGTTILMIIALLGVAIVRANLRTLVQIEQTAAAIAAGDLTRRVPDPEPDAVEPRTELGRLSRALNAMLAQIEAAFTARARSEGAARAAESAARAAAEAARASELRARRSEERMRQFVADASHELRTPLTTIRGFAELYRQGAAASPEEAARLVRRIEDEAARMGLLVEDLLLLARLDRERPLELVPVELPVLAADAVQAARAVAPQRRITLEIESGAAELVVLGDDARLRQVIGNLMANALAHTPPEASVTLRLRAEDDWAVVEVADTGPGLTPEQAERVFERFYRADVARTRRTDGTTGTGLGLAIVAALVAAHGGDVGVKDTPGGGATFWVRLPRSSRPEPD
ncbi:MAG TPA: ATP-binding protein [Micromonosporaceae bacterium]